MTTKTSTKATVAERLEALEHLQKIHSEIDKILIVRGELPIEVEELEADLEGLKNKVTQFENDLKQLEINISDCKNKQKDAQASILQYKEKQKNVRNNREFESINKEIEYQELEIQVQEKRINEERAQIEFKKGAVAEAIEQLAIQTEILNTKKSELETIIAETEAEEEKLNKKAAKAEKKLDDHLKTAYYRLRNNMKNGLAVVSIDRNSCGGCFSKVPPQRQIDILQKKKIIACEHCGRILVPGENEDTAEQS